jgi:chemotaxis protein MotB
MSGDLPDEGAERDERDVALARLRASLQGETPRDAGGAAWAVTFSDLMSLLLTFFVVLLSFSRIDMTQAEGFTTAVAESVGVRSPTPGSEAARGHSAQSGDSALSAAQRTGTLSGLKALVRRFGGVEVGGTVEVEVFESYRGVSLSMASPGLFEEGDVTLRPSAWAFVDELLELAVTQGCALEFWVHDGERLVGTEGLASERAAGLARYALGARGDLDPTSLSVRASGRELPRFPNDTEAHRRANRRVEVTFLDHAVGAEGPGGGGSSP